MKVNTKSCFKKLFYLAITIIFVVLTIGLCCVLLFDGKGDDLTNDIITIISFILTIISFPLTIISFKIVYEELKNGGRCTSRDAKKGGKKLAEYINSFQPTKIVYVAGNSGELFKNYIAKHITCNYEVIALNSYCRVNNGYVGTASIVTNKFIIDIAPTLFNKGEKVVILDDITKTGETINEIKNYLINTCKMNNIDIITCGFATDIYGYSRYAEPGFYYKRAKISDDYVFPWRK